MGLSISRPCKIEPEIPPHNLITRNTFVPRNFPVISLTNSSKINSQINC